MRLKKHLSRHSDGCYDVVSYPTELSKVSVKFGVAAPHIYKLETGATIMGLTLYIH
jgi:hypothetical protein